jgi:hypothetical protein
MIATIGSLVQVTSHPSPWPRAASLYTVCAGLSGAVVGALIGGLGALLRTTLPAPGWIGDEPRAGALLAGALALVYAASDLGIARLPRPRVAAAVPVTWWRRWRPYGASAAYGAALGTGVSTRVAFGGLYALLALCLVSGPAYGAALMGTYGLTRGFSIIPAGLALKRVGSTETLLSTLPFQELQARLVVAFLTAAFGAAAVSAALAA